MLRNHILTWDQLQRRGRQGPSLCVLCCKGEDTTKHLFMDCSFSKSIYSIFADHYKLPLVQHCTVISFLDFWFRGISVCSYFRYFPLYFFWCIWKQRNRCIFDNKQPSARALLKQIEDLIHLYSVPQKKRSRRLVGPGPLISYPCGFFDGATAENIGGVGFVILLDASYSINFSLGCGRLYKH